MKILIVYEVVPESTKFFTAEVTAEDWKWMALTHGQFINSDMPSKKHEAACNKLSTYLEAIKPTEHPEPIMMRGENYDYVLHTGFIL